MRPVCFYSGFHGRRRAKSTKLLQIQIALQARFGIFMGLNDLIAMCLIRQRRINMGNVS
jgi:hypothetical protein